MLNQLQRGDEPALRPCRRSGFLRRPHLGESEDEYRARYLHRDSLATGLFD